MLTALMTLLATLPLIFRSRAALELENLALRHQIGVLRRAAAKRLKLTSADRLLWICLSRLWRGWRSALTIVKPETVIAWHRAGFRLWLANCYGRADFTGNRAAQVNWLSLSERIRWQ
jgi:putative transposase